MRIAALAAVTVAALVAGGCAPGRPAGTAVPTPTCDRRPSAGVCSEYAIAGTYLSTLGQDTARRVCEAGGGTFAQGRCPRDGLVGRCVVTAGPGGGVTHSYYANGARPFDARRARATCEGGDTPGTFSASP